MCSYATLDVHHCRHHHQEHSSQEVVLNVILALYSKKECSIARGRCLQKKFLFAEDSMTTVRHITAQHSTANWMECTIANKAAGPHQAVPPLGHCTTHAERPSLGMPRILFYSSPCTGTDDLLILCALFPSTEEGKLSDGRV